ncbi:PAS domain-containing protein [Hellea sp.]|nr:PAS domain-containing protein [Hellea sp.]
MGHFRLTSDIPEKMRDFFLKSTVPLTICDARLDDSPLIGVNSAFCSLSGYDPDEMLERNCRFMQPEGDRMPVCERMRSFLKDDTAGNDRFLVPNVRKDGSRFVNLLYITKLQQDGATTHLLGSQFDFSRHGEAGIDLYDTALSKDIDNLNSSAQEFGWVFLGGYETLASSHALIAQARLE